MKVKCITEVPEKAPDLGENDYYIVMSKIRKDLLKSDPESKTPSLREFYTHGVSLFIDRPIIPRSKELVALSGAICNNGKQITSLALFSLYQIMDELSRSCDIFDCAHENSKLTEISEIIYAHYRNINDAYLSQTKILPEAIKLLKEGKWFPMNRVYIEIFPQLTLKEWDLLDQIAEKCEELVIVSPVISDSIKKFLQRHGASVPLSAYTSNGKPTDAFYYWDREEEIESIARQILALHHDGKLFSSIGVAVANPGDYFDLIKSLFDEYKIPYRVCARQLLKETKTFEFIFTLMDLIEQNFRIGDVQSLFNSPLVLYKSTATEKLDRERFNKLDLARIIGGLDDFDLKIKSHNDYLRNSEEFNELYIKNIEKYGKILMECLNRIKSKLDTSGNVEDLSKAMFELINDFSLSNHIFRGLEYKETYKPIYREATAYRELVSTLKNVSWVSKFVKIDGRDFFNVVRALLLSLDYEDRYYGDCVFIVADKDCFWLDFEHLFYCGLDLETLFPPTNPLLTKEECEELGILERKKMVEMRKSITLRNLRSNTVVSFVKDSDEQFTLLDALNIDLECKKQNGQIDRIYSKTDFERCLVKEPELIKFATNFDQEYVNKIEQAHRIMGFRDEGVPNEYNGIIGPGEFKETSPGALEDYVRCPFHFFAKYVLNLKNVKYETSENAEWGMLVHKVLKEFYSKDEGIDEYLINLRTSPEFIEKGREKMEYALSKLALKSDISIALRIRKAMENGAFKNFLFQENGAKKDAAMNQKGYKPTYLEHKVCGIIGDITLNGRIDRVDSYDNGIIVYDYKTGKPPNRNQKIDMLQIPLYLHLLTFVQGTMPMGGFYYYLGNENSRIENVFKDSIEEKIGEVVQTEVPAIIGSIKDGYFPRSYVENKHLISDPCKRCGMNRICKGSGMMRDYGPFARYYMKWRKNG